MEYLWIEMTKIRLLNYINSNDENTTVDLIFERSEIHNSIEAKEVRLPFYPLYSNIILNSHSESIRIIVLEYVRI